jgi:2-dehydro-3-deoxyphosphooctonate aldolase (KDO 8-P synthase)
MPRTVTIGPVAIGPGHGLAVIAGPCVIENAALTFDIARALRTMTQRLRVPLIFKASYDKANRTSLGSFRGPGPEEGLAILAAVRDELGVPVISDIHLPEQAAPAARVLDVLQIPALLSRQTDLLLAAAATGKPLNIKKGQFMAPWDMAPVLEKATAGGAAGILVTERGAMFGYNNLVADMRSIPILRDLGWPVIFDATHSVQLPGGAGNRSGGQREFAPVLARAAVAAGADGVFLEVHPDPDRALCDGPNSLVLDALPALLRQLLSIRAALSTEGSTTPAKR